MLELIKRRLNVKGLSQYVEETPSALKEELDRVWVGYDAEWYSMP
jgi:hypothetical protein